MKLNSNLTHKNTTKTLCLLPKIATINLLIEEVKTEFYLAKASNINKTQVVIKIFLKVRNSAEENVKHFKLFFCIIKIKANILL